MNADVSAFNLVKTTTIESLNIQYEEYEHLTTGARHIHLASDNNENVFMVALRTVPTDSTGVAHILEHTSLCGSKRFPVRDPFFMMIRRSLNTFMNAFTSSDWTAYPFASQNKKDFNNLLEVYLDAVFFARLDPLDFSQEGHRLEFEEPNNPDSDLVFKGVVFNEMKGAMSSISSQLWQAVGESLFPDTTYGVNSGGEPENITDLSYEQLQDFYKTHYHPDNATFVTFGDISAKEHQFKIQEFALRHFAPLNKRIEVPLQDKFDNAIRVTKQFPISEEEAKGDKTHLVMAWVLGSIRDPLELMSTHLLSAVLFENSASPLQLALETTDLGTAPSPLCGMDDSGLEMVFVCGVEGSSEDKLEQLEALVLNALQGVADNGVDTERMTALLDQLELQQREVGGGGYPYGLQIMLSCLPTAIHRGDAAAALNIDPILTQLRESIQDQNFIKSLVKRLLIDNQHRVSLVMTPDTKLSQQRIEQEQKKLAAIKATLTDEEKQNIITTAAALKERQTVDDDPEILPKVDLTDIPPVTDIPTFSEQKIANRTATFYPQGTNGLSYQQVITQLPTLNEQQSALLGIHNRVLTDLGVGSKDYLATQNWQTQVCGGINAQSSIRSNLDNEQDVSGYFTLSAKGLNIHNDAISDLLYQTYHHARFDEPQRIRELIAQSRARAEQSVTGNGHSLAMSLASQGFSPTAKLSHASSGILGIQKLKALDDSLENSASLNALTESLSDIHQTIISNPQQFLIIGEEHASAGILSQVGDLWKDSAAATNSLFSLPPTRENTRELWLCNTQVNFCAKAYQTVNGGHEDAPALTVLGGVLRNGFLHTTIREQGGAYGGGASQDSSIAAFRFYSYRDPRLGETLDDFDKSIVWLLEKDHEWRAVEEAILGVISSLDKPSSPAGTAKLHFHNNLFGRTPEYHSAFRDAVLSVTQADLKRVAEKYLRPEQASIGVISHKGEEANYKSVCDSLNLDIKQL
ncbi:MAG: insulinase family protein [Pseudomonadales bacterium]|nr:insulinase family protein [Pseudomonadales bacterium]